MYNFQKLSKTTSLCCNNSSENSVSIKGTDMCFFLRRYEKLIRYSVYKCSLYIARWFESSMDRLDTRKCELSNPRSRQRIFRCALECKNKCETNFSLRLRIVLKQKCIFHYSINSIGRASSLGVRALCGIQDFFPGPFKQLAKLLKRNK